MENLTDNNPMRRTASTSRQSKFHRTSLAYRNVRARSELWRGSKPSMPGVRRAFILGCGRSGTTILGQVLDLHPEITYFYEPKGRWAMIEPKTDIMGRYYPLRSSQPVDPSDISSKTIRRFRRLFASQTPMMLDKSPDGVFRLDYLSTLDPDATYIHIVRDGIEVAESVAEQSNVSHQLVGRHHNNRWWGVNDAKWTFLRKVALDRGYLVDETASAEGPAIRGLCEWLLGMKEIRTHQAMLGDRLLEIRYSDLVGDPVATLQQVATFLRLSPDQAWLTAASAAIRPQKKRTSELVVESPVLREELARARADYGLPAGASPAG